MCDVFLEVRREIIRTVLCCIAYWSCAQSEAYIDEQFLQFSRLGFVTLGPFHCVYIYLHLYVCILCFCFILHSCCIIVSVVGWTWWDWSLILRTYLPSVLWHCWLGHLTRKTRPRYDIYNVFGGTLNLAQSNPNSSRQSLYFTKNFYSAAVLGF